MNRHSFYVSDGVAKFDDQMQNSTIKIQDGVIHIPVPEEVPYSDEILKSLYELNFNFTENKIEPNENYSKYNCNITCYNFHIKEIPKMLNFFKIALGNFFFEEDFDSLLQRRYPFRKNVRYSERISGIEVMFMNRHDPNDKIFWIREYYPGSKNLLYTIYNSEEILYDDENCVKRVVTFCDYISNKSWGYVTKEMCFERFTSFEDPDIRILYKTDKQDLDLSGKFGLGELKPKDVILEWYDSDTGEFLKSKVVPAEKYNLLEHSHASIVEQTILIRSILSKNKSNSCTIKIINCTPHTINVF